MELDAVRANSVLKGLSAPCQPVKVKPELFFLANAEKIMQNPQTLGVVQIIQTGGQLFETYGQIAADPREKAAGFLNTAALHRHRNIAFLYNIVALCGFGQHHPIVLRTVSVPSVLFGGHQHFPLKLQLIEPFVDHRDFCDRIGWQRFFQRTIQEQHIFFILFIGNCIVDIRKAPAAAKFSLDLPDTVAVNPADGNGLLRCLWQTHRSLRLFFPKQRNLHLRFFLSFVSGVCKSWSYRFSLRYIRRPASRTRVLKIAQSRRSNGRPLKRKKPAAASGAAHSIQTQLAVSFPAASRNKK